MKALNTVKINFPAKSINESFARMAVSAFISLCDPTIEELCDIKTAVSEAVTNCIVHAYQNSGGTVYITAKLYPENRISIKIADKGCGIPDIEKALTPLYTSSPQGERAGLGFAVMEELSDKMTVRSVVGKGTTVTLFKNLSPKNYL